MGPLISSRTLCLSKGPLNPLSSMKVGLMVKKRDPHKEIGPLYTVATEGIFEPTYLCMGLGVSGSPLAVMGLRYQQDAYLHCIVHTLFQERLCADRQDTLWTYYTKITNIVLIPCGPIEIFAEVRFPLMSNGVPLQPRSGHV